MGEAATGAGNAPGGEPKPVEGQEKVEAPAAPKTELYSIVVDGSERQVTLDELKTLATKSAGADARFREASDLRKQNAAAFHLADMRDKAMAGELDDEGWQEYYAALGVSKLMKETETMVTPQGNTQGNAQEGPSAEAEEPQPVTRERLSPEMRQEWDDLKQQRLEAHQKKINEDIRTAVDKDEIFRTITGKDQVQLGAINDLVLGEVQRRVLVAKRPYGSEVVQEAVQSARSILSKLGKSQSQPAKPGMPGLGHASGLPPTLKAEELPKRVPINDPGYDQNFYERARWEFQQAGTEE